MPRILPILFLRPCFVVGMPVGFAIERFKSVTPMARNHPRTRGEHRGLATIRAPRPGSSPHARGALAQARPLVYEGGIIPACAGSTPRSCSRCGASRDHPRMRGEHYRHQRVVVRIAGSSPHARGALLPALGQELAAGIIPACAGSTGWTCARRRPSWDHPRMRGEHCKSVANCLLSSGSSPHARGALGGRSPAARTPGIIPACAGSTLSYPSGMHLYRDHPRMRGEHRYFYLRS